MNPLDPPVPATPGARPASTDGQLPLTETQRTQWQQAIKDSDAFQTALEPWQEAVLSALTPVLNADGGLVDPQRRATDIQTLRSYVIVERKIPDLFYQRPEVTQVPSPLMEGPIPGVQTPPAQPGQPPQGVPMTVAITANEEIVNEKLGLDGVNAKRLMRDVLFDIECTAGVGATKLGYESVTKTEETLDPATGLPRAVPVPVYERCYWEYIAPKQFRRPADFRSTDWERAPWLGFRFELPLTAGNRERFHLPPEFTPAAKAANTQHFTFGTPVVTAQQKFSGIEIWYRSNQFRDDVAHPEHFTQLVFVDGLDEPVLHQDSPHQEFLPNGKLSPTSLIGNPIHPFSVRSLTDSSFAPSDAMMIRPLEQELNRFREQMLEYRDAMLLRWQYDTSRLPPDALEKIVRSPIGGLIGVPPEAFHGDGAIKEMPQGHMPRESFTSNDYIDADIARTCGIDASGAGVQDQAAQTATAEQRQQSNQNARFDYERTVVLDRYIQGVTKFAQLIMRWLPVQQAAEIVGPQRAAWWDAWRKAVPAPVAFTAMPDSALRTDIAAERKQMQEFYSYIANDPYAAKLRPKVLKKLVRKFHIDPENDIVPPDPPKPEPPKLNLSFSGEDLVAPQGPIVIEILAQLGVTVKPETVQVAMAQQQQSEALAAQAEVQKAEAKAAPNTQHGGKLVPQESLSKHATDLTGGMQGSGEPAPMGQATGLVQ